MNNFGFPPGVEFPVCLRSYENQEGVEQILKRMTLEEINSMSENTQQKAEVFLEPVSLDWNREIATATFRIKDSLTQLSVTLPITCPGNIREKGCMQTAFQQTETIRRHRA